MKKKRRKKRGIRYDRIFMLIFVIISIILLSKLITYISYNNKVYNVETAEMGYAADFKRDMTVIEYDPNGTTGRKWLLKGCWPASIDNGELNYEDFGEKQLTIGIKYDKAYRITD